MFRSILIFIISIVVIYFIYSFFFGNSSAPSSSGGGISAIFNSSEDDDTISTQDILAKIDDFGFLEDKNSGGSSSSSTNDAKNMDQETPSSSGPANITIDPNGGIKKGTVGIDGFVPARVAAGGGFNKDCTGGIVFDPCLTVGNAIPANGEMYFGSDRS